MLLAGIADTRPQSVTAYSAKPPLPEHITRSPGFTSSTSLPTASTSPANSSPSTVPGPPAAPWKRPEAMMRTARLRPAARTRTRTWLAPGLGLGMSRTSMPLPVSTAAFMMRSPPLAVIYLRAAFVELSTRLDPGQGAAGARLLRRRYHAGRVRELRVDADQDLVNSRCATNRGGLPSRAARLEWL